MSDCRTPVWGESNEHWHNHYFHGMMHPERMRMVPPERMNSMRLGKFAELDEMVERDDDADEGLTEELGLTLEMRALSAMVKSMLANGKVIRSMYAGTERWMSEFVSLDVMSWSKNEIIPPLFEVLMIDSDTHCDYSDDEAIESTKRVVDLGSITAIWKWRS